MNATNGSDGWATVSITVPAADAQHVRDMVNAMMTLNGHRERAIVGTVEQLLPDEGAFFVREGQAVRGGRVQHLVGWGKSRDGRGRIDTYVLRPLTDEAPLCRYCGHPIKGPAKAGECLQSEDALHRQRDGSNG